MTTAFHLPALSRIPTTTWSYGSGAAEVRLRIPQLTPALLHRQIKALGEARDRHLAGRPVREIVGTIDAAAARLADPGDSLRQEAEATLPAVTGYSPAMIRHVLDGMVLDWRADRLWELLRAEFGDPRVLDEFCPRGATAGASRAFGPRLAVHVFSGNVPGVAVNSMVRSLLVKAATLGKTAAGEPLLPTLFAQAITETDAEMGACLAVTYWPGGSDALEEIALAAADAVIAYGSAATVSAVRARVSADTRFVGYGHKVSFGIVARDTLAGEAAEESAASAALDAATFDQQGCVSPHLFYVEEGGAISPRDWARMLAFAMERIEHELPRGTVAPGEASAIRQLRGEAEFSQIAGSGIEVHHSADGTAWTVIYEPDPTFAASCLNRVVRVKPLPDLSAVAALIERIGPLLQTVGIAVPESRRFQLATTLGRLGASRITPLGAMAWPPSSWHHDGQPPLGALVRWCDLEELRVEG